MPSWRVPIHRSSPSGMSTLISWLRAGCASLSCCVCGLKTWSPLSVPTQRRPSGISQNALTICLRPLSGLLTLMAVMGALGVGM